MAELGLVLASLLTTFLVMAPLIRVLRRSSLVDVPNARSSHLVATPRGGGIAVMAGVLAGCLAGGAPARLWVVVGLAMCAAALGLADDVRGLSAQVRLAVQTLLSVGVVAVLHDFTSPVAAVFGLVAVVGIVGYVNAFNFMDGINAISGVTGVLAGAWYAGLGAQQSDRVLVVGGLTLVGACLGFLPWNAPRARVFLGDVGSYGLGLLIGALALRSLIEGMPLAMAGAPLLLYLADTAWTLVRRLRRGESWREAHREHIYQRLCDARLTHVQVTSVVAAHAGIICAALHWLSPVLGMVVVSAALGSYIAFPGLLMNRVEPSG